MLDRRCGPRVEQMAVTAAVDLEVAFVVSARCHRRITEFDAADQRLRLARMAQADAPRCSVELRADDAHVAAEVHETVPDVVIHADRRDAVRGVFLADAAEIELHPGARQSHGPVAPLDAFPSDELARGRDLLGARNVRRLALEIPRA